MQKEINELKRQLGKNKDKTIEQKVSYVLIFISPFLNIIIIIIMIEFNYNYKNNYQR